MHFAGPLLGRELKACCSLSLSQWFLPFDSAFALATGRGDDTLAFWPLFLAFFVLLVGVIGVGGFSGFTASVVLGDVIIGSWELSAKNCVVLTCRPPVLGPCAWRAAS